MKTPVAALGCVVVALVVLTGCDGQTPKTNAHPTAATRDAIQPAVERTSNVDLWERSRQCAEQAEKVVKRIGEDMISSGPDFPRISAWTNHYSPRFERCFVRITFRNRQPDRKNDIPLYFDELHDAFENRVLATHTMNSKSDGTSMYCETKELTTSDCRMIEGYIDERMSK